MSDIEAKYRAKPIKPNVKVSTPHMPSVAADSTKSVTPAMTFGTKSATPLSGVATVDSSKPVLPAGMFSLKPKIQMEDTTPSVPSTKAAMPAVMFPVKPFALSTAVVESPKKTTEGTVHICVTVLEGCIRQYSRALYRKDAFLNTVVYYVLEGCISQYIRLLC